MEQKQVKKTITISKDDFDTMMEALQLTREQVGKLCNVSPHGVSWWRSGQKIPYKHLVRLATELVRQLHIRPETELDTKALDVFQRKNALSDLEGSAKNQSLGVYYNPKSAFHGLAFNSLDNELIKSALKGDTDALASEPRRVQPFSNQDLVDQKDQLLALFDIDDLLREIKRRVSGPTEPKE